MKWNKNDQPRDRYGQFAEKDETYYRQNASYGEILAQDKAGKESAQPEERTRKSSGTDEKKRAERKKELARDQEKIRHAVFDRISTVRQTLAKDGFAMIRVYTWDYEYKVKLYGPEEDYRFEIISKKRLK